MHKKLWILLLFVGIGFIGLSSCSKYGVVDGCFKSDLYCKGKADYNPNLVPYKLSKVKLAELKQKAVESRARADAKAMKALEYTKQQIKDLKKSVTKAINIVGRDGRLKYPQFWNKAIKSQHIFSNNDALGKKIQDTLILILPTNAEMALRLAIAYNKSIDERFNIDKCNDNYWLFYQLSHKAVVAANSSTKSYVSPAMAFQLSKRNSSLRNMDQLKWQNLHNFWDKKFAIYYSYYLNSAGTPNLFKWDPSLHKYTLNPSSPAYINNTVYVDLNHAGGYSYNTKYYHSKNIFAFLDFNSNRNLDLMLINGNICYDNFMS